MIGPYDLPDEPATTPTGLPAGPDVTQPIELVPDDNLLVTAAKLLRARGRCRLALIDGNGCMCPVGALAVTAGISTDQLDEYERRFAAGEDLSLLPFIHFTVNRMPEAHHLAAVVRASGSEWATRSKLPPTWTLWFWADRVDDDEVLRLLDAAADTFEAVPA